MVGVWLAVSPIQLIQLDGLYDSCEDQIVVGICNKSQWASLTSPLTKRSLSNVVICSDAKAKSDYFSQQSDFVNRLSKTDKLAEFSENIEGMLVTVVSGTPAGIVCN